MVGIYTLINYSLLAHFLFVAWWVYIYPHQCLYKYFAFNALTSLDQTMCCLFIFL
jgi:hypothetical protein